MAKAWIVFQEEGEYSEHSFNVIAVALTEEAAQAACEKAAKASSDKARRVREGDRGWSAETPAAASWVICCCKKPVRRGDHYSQRVPSEECSSADCTVYGYQDVEVVS